VADDRHRRVVLLALDRKLTNAEIGSELFITEHPVKTHVANVLMKLQQRDRVHAYETGLVPCR
jgi:DNA-binding NarL/FixJ family response regulator